VVRFLPPLALELVAEARDARQEPRDRPPGGGGDDRGGEELRAAPALLTLAMVRRFYVPLGERTLFRLVSSGQFPAADVRVGGELRLWRRATVERWITAACEAGASAAVGRRQRKARCDMAWLERRHGKYRICDRDGAGKTWRTVAYGDKAASKQMMADLERALARGERGLVDPFGAHRGRPLAEHMADWVASLRERGKDDRYVAPCEARVTRLAAECGWRTLADIDANAFDRWRETATSNVAHNRKDAETAFSGQSQAASGHEEMTEQPLELRLRAEDRHLMAATGTDVRKAGDGIRTHDVQLGKLAFYH
jgi:predicted DNA-binding transcriptional regulator AlpA